jgi:hypothetical protein
VQFLLCLAAIGQLASRRGKTSPRDVAHASSGVLLLGQMYSCSRSCLRNGKLLDLTNTRARPRAPLDFLYPRWFTNNRARPDSFDPHHLPHEHGEARGGQERLIRRVTADTSQDPELRQIIEGLWNQFMASYQLIGAAKRELHQLDVIFKRRKRLAKVVDRRLQHRAGKRDVIAEGAAPVRQCEYEALRLRKMGSEPMSPKAAKQLLMKFRHDPSQMKWTVPTTILSNAMEKSFAREGTEILLAEQTIISLTGTTRENTWIHQARGGCEIQVLSRLPGWSGKRRVLLYGSSRAREVTEEYLLAQDARVAGSAQNSGESNDVSPEGSGRWVPTKIHSDVDMEDAVRADELPVPETWSVRTFAQYVEDLCTMRLTRAKKEELYPFDETFNQNVAGALQDLFTTDGLKHHISSHALNVALQFTCKHSELGRTRDLLYAQAKQLGLHRQIWMYNLLIERALKMNETDALSHLVKDMQAAGVVPNGLTWAKLLLVVKSSFARRQLVDFILRIYPHDFAAVMDHLARRLIQKELPEITRKSDGYQLFVEQINKAFGPSWLNSQTLSRVLLTCAQHKLWEVAANTLKLASERGVTMTSQNINALMNFYYQKGDLQAAIDLLRSPWVNEMDYDGEQVIPRLFLLAWNRQRWNVCRVLWQYAASRGLISYQMQMRVHRSLTRNQHLAVLPPFRTFGSLAGKLIIGTDLDNTKFDEQFPRLSEYFSTTKDPIQWLAQWTPNNGAREEQLALAYMLINRDLTAWKVLKPIAKDDLPELLNTARRKDQAWVAQKFDKHATLAEMLANAIQVPLLPAEEHRHFHVSTPAKGDPLAWELNELGNQVSLKPFIAKECSRLAKMVVSALSLPSMPENLCSAVASIYTALQRFAPSPALNQSSVWCFLFRRSGSHPTHALD